jgi:hypothetical protein
MRGNRMSIGLSKCVLRTRVLVAGSLLFGLAGCSFQNPLDSSGPEPRVEDCMLLQQATPAKFVCDGKTYTAVQLSDIRTAKPATAAK